MPTFKSIRKARSYQKSFRRTYGYIPSLFIQGKKSYHIVKPKGLQKIKW